MLDAHARIHPIRLLLVAGALCAGSMACDTTAARPDRLTVDLLSLGEAAWREPDTARWSFDDGAIRGATRLLDGAKTDPEASTFLVSRQTYGGDLAVSIDVSFEHGRYLGVYLDYGQASQSGMWLATGHPLPDDPDERTWRIETAYIKTVDEADWIVRSRGELLFAPNEIVKLKMTRVGDDYSLWRNERLIVTYRKPGGYPPGPLQLRLTNANATIHRLIVESDWVAGDE